jgi:hypothetical protein
MYTLAVLPGKIRDNTFSAGENSLEKTTWSKYLSYLKKGKEVT